MLQEARLSIEGALGHGRYLFIRMPLRACPKGMTHIVFVMMSAYTENVETASALRNFPVPTPSHLVALEFVQNFWNRRNTAVPSSQSGVTTRNVARAGSTKSASQDGDRTRSWKESGVVMNAEEPRAKSVLSGSKRVEIGRIVRTVDEERRFVTKWLQA
jgi:hypothetical protein